MPNSSQIFSHFFKHPHPTIQMIHSSPTTLRSQNQNKKASDPPSLPACLLFLSLSYHNHQNPSLAHMDREFSSTLARSFRTFVCFSSRPTVGRPTSLFPSVFRRPSLAVPHPLLWGWGLGSPPGRPTGGKNGRTVHEGAAAEIYTAEKHIIIAAAKACY